MIDQGYHVIPVSPKVAGKTLLGQQGYATLDDFKGLAALMAKGVIRAENLITGKIELKDILDKGFLELINNKDQHIKILVRP